jgi:transcriptional regulator with XRE-family HTH domain
MLHFAATMDFDAIARQLVRALRGPRSQEACNRRLGYTSNVFHAWESGSRKPTMSDLWRLAALSRVDVPQALLSILRKNLNLQHSTHPRSPSGIDGRAWLTELTVGWSAVELARELRCNRNTVARWLQGQTEPKVHQVLHLVNLTTQRLLDFVGQFVPLSEIPALARSSEDLRRQRALAYEIPWAHAVLRVLEIEDYRQLPAHTPGFIASRLGLTFDEEEAALAALAAAKQIRKSRGLWRPTRVLSVDTSTNRAADIELKRYWARVGSQRVSESALGSGALFSYNVFTISDEGYQQIRRAHLEYYDRLRAIVAEHRGPTRVVLANVHLIPLDLTAADAQN